jgi:hypothetical protein
VSVDQFLNTAELIRKFATNLVSVTTIHPAALKSCGASDLKRAAHGPGSSDERDGYGPRAAEPDGRQDA